MSDWDKTKGKLKEKEGEVTGDETREAQGKAEQGWADTKDKAGELKDAVTGDD
jgi:uncharacterized protein YjbJ (UPF0337 family)